MHELHSKCRFSGNSLMRISVLGADGVAVASSLSGVLGKVSSIFGLQNQGNDYTTRTLHFRSLFSMVAAVGSKIKIVVKYVIEASCPMETYGYSTGCPPIHVRINRFAVRNHRRHWLRGRKDMLRCFDKWVLGNRARIRIDSMRATTPPSLLGMERRMA